jgi:murein DD-endopeptidase MepM/ murein hydrolase activator NlpD
LNVGQAAKIIKRVLFVTYLMILHVIAAFFLYQIFFPNGISSLSDRSAPVADPAIQREVPTPLPVPSSFVDGPEANVEANSTALASGNTAASDVYESPSGLLIPVAGIKPEQLMDTFSSARSEGRVHDAIDIPAPAGSPVVAVADGTLLKFFDSERGGITIYELSDDKKYFFYYAHLQRRADDLHEGGVVKKGTTIGYVGDTGNAGPGNYHLHFAISIVTDPKRFWDGQPINPYPILSGKTQK